MVKVRKDLTGMEFGRLIVLCQAEDYINPKGIHFAHGNKTRYDNRKCNLRICTRGQNCCNKVDMSNNTSGCIGVTWHKRSNKWMARITLNSQDIYLGLFNDKQDAINARLEAEKQYFKEFAPIRKGENI